MITFFDDTTHNITLDANNRIWQLDQWDERRWEVKKIEGECTSTEEQELDPVCVVRITSNDDYTGEYTYHEWSFKTRWCTDIRKCKGEGDWIVDQAGPSGAFTNPDAVRAFFLMGAPYDHTSEDCRCLLWFHDAAGAFLDGSDNGLEIISEAGMDSVAISAGMRHYWLHCQVNFAHQLEFYHFADTDE
jgi:hypothetical protein